MIKSKSGTELLGGLFILSLMIQNAWVEFILSLLEMLTHL